MAFEHELSQDEIDALLQGVTGEAEPAPVITTAPEGPLAYKLGTDERVVRGRASEKDGLASLDADVGRILEKRRWLLARR